MLDTWPYPGRMTEMKQGPTLIGREEAAAIGGVSTRTITRYVKAGFLTPYRDVPGRVRFSREQVRELFRLEADPS
jgi:predicted site-specific integrase-resolvase